MKYFWRWRRKRVFRGRPSRLHRTQPAVSQAIRRLEAELGEPLFDRSSKDGTLTAAGRVLFDFAQQMLNLRQHAHTAIRELKDLHRGKLTLSANEYTVMYLLPLIPVFRARHPHIKVEVKRSLASRIPSEILGRDVEIGVVSFKPTDQAISVDSGGDGRTGSDCGAEPSPGGEAGCLGARAGRGNVYRAQCAVALSRTSGQDF